MAFLAPLWLALALAAGVPLLVHLLRRRIGARVEFPAARYLERAEREHSRKLRLRNLLLMAVRVLLVLALALAAARPVGRVAGGGHAPTALALVLDNSLSTAAVVDGRPALDRLREAARRALERAGDADRLWLLTADGVALGGTRQALIEAVGRVAPLAGAGDLPGAAARAVALVSAAGMPARAVAVITDGQATAWRRPVSAGDVPVRLLAPVLPPPANRAVTLAVADPVRWTPRGSVRARVLAPTDSVAYRVSVGGGAGAPRTIARGTASGEVTVRVAPTERGWLAGAVELEPDELRGDDARPFAAWVGPAPAIRLSPAAGPFAASATAALVQSGRARTTALPSEPWVDVAPADELARLPAMILAPSSAVRVGAANRALERLGVPWRFGPLVERAEGARWTGRTGAQADAGTVRRRFALARSGLAPADTLARVGPVPWIVGGPGYVIVASAIDPAASDLPVRAAFVPWLADVLAQRLGGEAGMVIEAAPGATVSRPAAIDAMETVAGERRPIAEGRLTAPGRPGVYFLLRGGARAGALVVAAEPDESSLARAPLPALRARLDGRDVVASADAAQWAARLFRSGARRPLLGPVVVLAMLLLVLETAMARGRGARVGAEARAAA